MKRVYLFGAGVMGKQAVEMYGPCVKGFVDNDEKQDGKMVKDIPVFSYTHYLEIRKKEDVVIITSPTYEKDIKKQLDAAGITNYIGNYFLKPYRVNKKAMNTMEGYPIFVYSEQPEYTKFLVMQFRDEELTISTLDSMGEKVPEEAVIVLESRDYAALKVRLENTYSNEIVCLCRINTIYENEQFYLIDENAWRTGNKPFQSVKDNVTVPLIDSYVNEVRKYPLCRPVNISFETISKCNGLCSFCPVNARDDKRETELMDEEMFHKVIGELEEMNYEGEVAMYTNNEPLLDKRIVRMTEYAREHLPNAMIRMLTNGTLMTIELFDELTRNLDRLLIENYSDDCTMNSHVKRIYDYCMEHPEKQKRTTIWMRKQTDILSTRGGLAPNRKNMDDVSTHSCAQPFQTFYIHPNGDCSICCADPFSEIVLGNVKEHTILDIWNNEAYAKVRTDIAKGRKYIEKCSNCDQFPYYCM